MFSRFFFYLKNWKNRTVLFADLMPAVEMRSRKLQFSQRHPNMHLWHRIHRRPVRYSDDGVWFESLSRPRQLYQHRDRLPLPVSRLVARQVPSGIIHFLLNHRRFAFHWSLTRRSMLITFKMGAVLGHHLGFVFIFLSGGSINPLLNSYPRVTRSNSMRSGPQTRARLMNYQSCVGLLSTTTGNLAVQEWEDSCIGNPPPPLKQKVDIKCGWLARSVGDPISVTKSWPNPEWNLKSGNSPPAGPMNPFEFTKTAYSTERLTWQIEPQLGLSLRIHS